MRNAFHKRWQYKLQTKDLCRQARLAGINYKYTNELL